MFLQAYLCREVLGEEGGARSLPHYYHLEHAYAVGLPTPEEFPYVLLEKHDFADFELPPIAFQYEVLFVFALNDNGSDMLLPVQSLDETKDHLDVSGCVVKIPGLEDHVANRILEKLLPANPLAPLLAHVAE